MATWTLAKLRTKVREVTGRLSPGEISNAKIDDYINLYYQYTFPAEVKLVRNHTFYEFLTTPNQAWYSYPTSYTNIEPPATIDGFSLSWHNSPVSFYAYIADSVVTSTPWTGDGVTTTFSETVGNFPIMPDSIVITDNTETFEDTTQTYTTSDVSLTGDLGGGATINYSTGVISVAFTTAPTDEQDIYLSYITFTASRPTDILVYNNQIRLYPVPKTAYRFRTQAYAVLTALTNATDRPELDQWGPCIAYGASRDILADSGEMGSYGEVTSLYKEQLSYVLKRTNQTLLNERSTPSF